MKRNIYLILALLFAGSMQLRAQQMVVVTGAGETTHTEYPYEKAKITFSNGQMLFHFDGKVAKTYNIKDIGKIYFYVENAAVDAMSSPDEVSYSSHHEELTVNAHPGTPIVLYHANGAQVLSYVQTIASMPVSVAHLPAGVYMVAVGGKTLKFVKQ